MYILLDGQVLCGLLGPVPYEKVKKMVTKGKANTEEDKLKVLIC